MRCDRKLLSEYKDGELSPQHRRTVDEHLAGCAVCRATLQEYHRISRAIRALPRYEVPSGLVRDVCDKVEAERFGSGPSRGWASVLRFGSLAAAGVVLVLATAILLRSAPSPQPEIRANETGVETAYVEQLSPTALPAAAQPTPEARERAFESSPEPPRPPAVAQAPTAVSEPGTQASPTPIASSPQPAAPDAAPAGSTPAVPQAVVAPAAPPVAVPEPATPTPSPEVARAVAEIPLTPGRETPGAQPPPGTPTPASGPASVAATGEVTPSVTVSTTAGCALAPQRGFGLVYGENPNVGERLGCALGGEKELPLAEERFENGHALWRGDTRQVYVLSSKGTWKVFKDTWAEVAPPSAALVPPEGKLVPVRGIGKVWHEDASARATIGWAVEAERGYSGALQEFEKGAMLWSDRQAIFVLYADGTWQEHPDTYREHRPEELGPGPFRK